MSGYNHFARFYDALTRNVDYGARADYFTELASRHIRREAAVMLDLACGTGSLTEALAAKGFEMIAADASAEMLSLAAGKLAQNPDITPPLLLCQEMQNLDLYDTVDACVCALDSLNHLPDERALRQAFERVALFLSPGGVFLFDVNTLHKHRDILADNAYVYETDEVYCVWRNAYRPADGGVEIALDFFVPAANSRYERYEESFAEALFPPAVIEQALEQAGLELAARYGDDGFEPPDEKTQRIVYVARKQGDA